jgi:hypothetical protein
MRDEILKEVETQLTGEGGHLVNINPAGTIEINLSNRGFNNAYVEKLVGLFKGQEQRVSALDLSSNNIGDKGIELVIAKFPQLKTLMIGQNNITDKGASAIAAHSSLNYVNVSENNIKEQGIQILIAQFGEQQLSISGNPGVEIGEIGLALTRAVSVTARPAETPELKPSPTPAFRQSNLISMFGGLCGTRERAKKDSATPPQEVKGNKK